MLKSSQWLCAAGFLAVAQAPDSGETPEAVQFSSQRAGRRAGVHLIMIAAFAYHWAKVSADKLRPSDPKTLLPK